MAVEVTGKYIRIRVQHRGERVEGKWPEAATEASIRAAKRASHRIKRDLEDGCFRAIEDYLPGELSDELFGAYALNWLKSHQRSPGTKEEYRKALNRFWLPLLGDRKLSLLRPSDIKRAIASCEFPSGKTQNNAQIPLRQILKAARYDEMTSQDLSDFVLSVTHQAPPPDPFSQEEAEQIIAHFKGHHMENYWEYMFFSGFRVGEGIGLNWPSIDWEDGTVEAHETQSKGRSLRRTKTAKRRTVRLHPRAMGALKRQKAKTFLMGGRVFMTEQGTPYITEKAQRAAFTKALKELKIRHRPMKNTRHTYATYLLMSGCTPLWVANQMGHDLKVLLSKYARWITGDDDLREMEKLGIAGK